jgi:hypothetical protein
METCRGVDAARPSQEHGMTEPVEPVETIRLQFTHVRAWTVIGGIGMPQGKTGIPLAKTADGVYRLETDINDALALSDRGQAIGNAMLAAMVGQSKGTTADERLAAAIDEVRKERDRNAGKLPLLLFVGHGEIDVKQGGTRREEPDYVMTFDSIDKVAVRDRYSHGHRSMQLALALESSTRVRFNEIAVGTYCTALDGKTVYSINITGSGEATVSTSLPESALESINRRFSMLNGHPELTSTVRLFADMALWGREPFRAFVSGWTALEILIKKTFRDYEDAFYGGLAFPHQPELAVQFLKRVREALGPSPNVKDQFLAMSSVLLPQQPPEEAIADLQTFQVIKKQRDRIAHGAEFDESRLPINELSRLLTKYLAAHADRSTRAVASAPAHSTN